MSEVNNKWPQEGINPDVNKEYTSPKAKPEDMAEQREATREELWDLKSEVWIFEAGEPNTKMCSYMWLRIKFPWKKIKNIISVTSSTWWTLNNYKMAEDRLTFNVIDKSWENKDIDKKIIHNDTVQLDWVTPNADYSILSFMIELEDWTKEIIKRKVKLTNTPDDMKKSRDYWNIDNKITTEKIAEPTLWLWYFVWETPDRKETPYKGLVMEFPILPLWKEIKKVISIESSNGWKIDKDKFMVLDSNKIQFDFLTPKKAWTVLTIKVEFTDWTIGVHSKPVTLPENKKVSKDIEK